MNAKAAQISALENASSKDGIESHTARTCTKRDITLNATAESAMKTRPMAPPHCCDLQFILADRTTAFSFIYYNDSRGCVDYPHSMAARWVGAAWSQPIRERAEQHHGTHPGMCWSEGLASAADMMAPAASGCSTTLAGRAPSIASRRAHARRLFHGCLL